MYVLTLAYKRLVSRPGSSILSVLLFGIGVSIISLIVLADRQVQQSIERNLAGIDLVVGAKGSPLQLILSSVLHADYPTGNISMQQAQRIAEHPLVKKSVPLALGDSYKGFRIVGAPVDYPRLYEASVEEGEWYEHAMQAVLGYNVARRTGLNVGDTFYGVHGFQDVGHAHDDHIYTVTGILQPGAGVVDNLILTPVESVWKVHEEHDHREHYPEKEVQHSHEKNRGYGGAHENHNRESSTHTHDEHHMHNANTDAHAAYEQAGALPLDESSFEENIEQRISALPGDDPLVKIHEKVRDGKDISREQMEAYQAFMEEGRREVEDDREITALLLVYRSAAANIQIPRMINETTHMQAASPALEMNRLFSLLSFGIEVLRWLAWIIIVISGMNIFVHLWNTLRQGMHEIALLRVLGAGRLKVFFLLTGQGAMLAIAGWLLGILLSRGVWLLLPSLYFMPGMGLIAIQWQEIMLLVYAFFTGLLASVIPAVRAYKTDVHFALKQYAHA